MRCTKCGNESTTGRKFCATCGNPLSSRCPKCGAENVPASAFCEDCGAALADTATSTAARSPQAATAAAKVRVTPEQPAGDPPEGERKTVTALFADIKGSMELMEDLDPEEARAIIDPALKLMIDAVRRYDGYVVQSTGDGIFALFGAPVAHEDHPQRALYAALRLQEELKRYSDRMRQEGRLPLQARVGVNTGEVVVRSIQTGEAHAEYTPIGHTANLAARMQVLAPIGSIAATEQVRKLCEGYFLFNGLGPTKVKGVSEPVNVYEVTGLGPLRTRLQRAAGRGLTRFVGRQREMEALKQAAEHAKGGRGQIAAAMAEPGVGKSRLFFEFKATSAAGWMVLETFSISHGKASAYLPVIDLLRNYFRIANQDDERTRREKVNGKILTLDRALEDTIPYLFSLLSIVEGNDPVAQMDGQIKKRRTLEAIKRILLRESLNQPLMAIFEDLHWIDSETQELLNLLADSIGSAKILLLVNYRPEYRHEWGNRTHYTQLRLDPLGKESAEEMLSALLGDGPDLQSLKRLIIERTEGNPFFMEETVQMLFDEGALARNGTVRLTKSLNELKIPPTAQAILTARIDRLPPDEKNLLQTLAVLGKEFTLLHLKATVAMSDSELERMLADLQVAEFIYEQPALGNVEFTFKHALTQEVAYHSVLTERRRMLHERAGAAIEKLFADRPEEHIDQLAYHYGRGTNLTKAIEYLQRAGEQAVARSSFREGVEKLNGALELLRTLPASLEHTRRELALQMSLGSAFVGLKGFGSPEREGAYNRASELCQQLEESRELFPVLWNLCQLNIQRGELRAARELARQSLSLAERVQDGTFILAAQYNLGEICEWAGELTQAHVHLEHAKTLYDPRQHASLAPIYGVDLSVGTYSVADSVDFLLGKPDQALKRARAALERASALSHPFSRAFAPVGFEWTLFFLRAAREAEEVAHAAISVCTEQGFTDLLAWANCFLGWSLIEQGKLTDGIAKLSEGIVVLDSIRNLISKSLFLGALAEGYKKAGDSKRALELLDEAVDWANRTGERFYECELHRLRGEVLLMGNGPNAPAADNCFRKAIELARVQSAKAWELRATMSLSRLLAEQGKRSEAHAMLGDIYNWFTEGFDTADLRDAKALLNEFAG
jgi:class 3 adenylate cyclase/predicted ATPase